MNHSGVSWAGIFALGVWLVMPTAPLALADESELDPDRVEFVMGNATFVVLHEIAHAVIQDYDLPMLGNGEDAADTLAAVSLIRRDRAEPVRDFRYIRMLLMAADAQRVLWNTGLERDNPVTYLANHPLSVQRAARIACLAYGSDPEVLEPLPEIVGLPEFRTDWCDGEYADAEKAWLWVRDSYVRKAAATTSEHSFYYGRARGEQAGRIRSWLEENKMLERTLAVINRLPILEHELTLITRSCGSPEAYWDANTRNMVVCYELLGAFYELAEEESIKELEQKIRHFHDNKDVESPNDS